MSVNPDVTRLMIAMAAYYGQKIEDHVLLMYAEDLADIPLESLKQAFQQIRRDPKVTRFPLPAMVRDRVSDGRPGAEEAWALCPKDEFTSVVWTDEVAQAFGAARVLLEEDPIAARMAFKESYARIVSEAKASGRAPKWEASLGHDKSGRESALREAVNRGRLSLEYAKSIVPEIDAPKRQVLISHDGDEPEPDANRVRALLAGLMAPKELA
jgi:hypothetical protein